MFTDDHLLGAGRDEDLEHGAQVRSVRSAALRIARISLQFHIIHVDGGAAQRAVELPVDECLDRHESLAISRPASGCGRKSRRGSDR